MCSAGEALVFQLPLRRVSDVQFLLAVLAPLYIWTLLFLLLITIGGQSGVSWLVDEREEEENWIRARAALVVLSFFGAHDFHQQPRKTWGEEKF